MSSTMIIRMFLILTALCFAAFGQWSLMSPLEMASGLGVNVSGPNGAYELAGIYGGVSLAAAALCLSGAITRRMRRPALWFLVTYMGGYVFARVVAWVLHGPPTSDFYIFIAFEACVLLGALFSLSRKL